MESSEELIKIQHEVLTEMGKNLFNYQIIEGILKKIVATSSIEVLKKCDGEFAVKSIKTERMMLGNLLHTFISDIAVTSTNQQYDSTNETDLESNGLRFKSNFQLELFDQTTHEKLKSTIKQLVYGRNVLVHQFHELHSLNTKESCLVALTYLKDKNIFILEQLNYFKEIALELDSTIKAMAEFMNSAEYEQLITSINDDINTKKLH